MSKTTFHIDKEFGSLKITTTTKDKNFIFLNDKYSLSVFRNAQELKLYEIDSHFYFSLVQDKYGRLFFHSWSEDLNFSGGADYFKESFSLVKDELEAVRMFEGKVPMYRRMGCIPLVSWSEENFILAIEKAEESL